MPNHPYLPWPVFRRSVVAAFERSLTGHSTRTRYISAACHAPKRPLLCRQIARPLHLLAGCVTRHSTGSTPATCTYSGFARQARTRTNMASPKTARHLQPLSDRLGRRPQYAVPDVQALLAVCRRDVLPAGHPLAESDQGERRSAPSVPSLHRHRADHSRGRRLEMPKV